MPKSCKCKCKCKPLSGLFTGTINFASLPQEAFSLNFGKDGTLTVTSRLEFPTFIPNVPGDLESAGVGQWECAHDGSYNFSAIQYRQGSLPTIFHLPLTTLPNYVFVMSGNVKVSKCGKIVGTMKLGAGNLDFALPGGTLVSTVPIDSITLRKQKIKDLYNAIP